MQPRSWLLTIWLMLTTSISHAATEVIELQHRMASEILPAITSLLEPYERASHYGHQIIIQAEDKKIAELRSLIQQLDTPPKRLLISVDNSGNRVSTERGFNIDTRVSDKNGYIISGQKTSSSVQIKHRSSQGNNADIRSVQTLEGHAALVQTGQQIQQSHWGAGHNQRPQRTITTRELSQGFYAVAYVHGDMVTIELSNHADQLDPTNQNITQRQASSAHLSGRLNEWIPVSNISGNHQNQSSELLGHNKQLSTNNNNLRIKVEVVGQ